MRRSCLRGIALLVAVLFFAQPAFAQNCAAPPQGAGPAWWQDFSHWCSACGGAPNAEDATCAIGASWGEMVRPLSGAGSGPADASAFLGQWAMTYACGGASGSSTLNIVSADGAPLAVKGDIGNCAVKSSRLVGRNITMACRQGPNSCDFQGSLVSDTLIRGTYTQNIFRGTCEWYAVKAAQEGSATATARSEDKRIPASAPPVEKGERNREAGDASASPFRSRAGGGVFVGKVTAAQAVKTQAVVLFSGTIDTNWKIEVLGDDGTPRTFFIRHDAMVVLADGTTADGLPAKMAKSIKGRRVEVAFAPITDATGGYPSGKGFSFEIGQDAALSLRFLD